MAKISNILSLMGYRFCTESDRGGNLLRFLKGDFKVSYMIAVSLCITEVSQIF